MRRYCNALIFFFIFLYLAKYDHDLGHGAVCIGTNQVRNYCCNSFVQFVGCFPQPHFWTPGWQVGGVIARDTGGREAAGQIGQGGGEEEKTSKEEIRRQVMLDYPYFPTEGLEKFMEPAKYF